MGGEFKMEKSEVSAGSQHRGAGKDGGRLARGLQESSTGAGCEQSKGVSLVDSKSGPREWDSSSSVSSAGFCCIQLIIKPDQL